MSKPERRGPISVLLDTLRYNPKGVANLAFVLAVLWACAIVVAILVYSGLTSIQP